MTEEDIRRIIKSQIINIDDEDIELLKKRRKFFKWNSLFSIAMIIVIGENIIQYKWIYTAFLSVIFIYNVISNFKIYSIKYKSLKSIIGHLAIDSLISISLLTLSVLLNLGIISLGKFNISGLDIAMLSCFGLIPFAKQNSFAYFAVEHYKLREDLKKDIEQK